MVRSTQTVDAMREFDEAHLQRLLRAEVEKNGGNYLATDRALGLPARLTYHVLKGKCALTPKVAAALGFRRAIPGRLSGAHRPVKFVVAPFTTSGLHKEK